MQNGDFRSHLNRNLKQFNQPTFLFPFFRGERSEILKIVRGLHLHYIFLKKELLLLF